MESISAGARDAGALEDDRAHRDAAEDVAEQLGVKFVKASVESESPVVGVTAYVERHLCDLLVMMTRPRSALERLLASSVAEETARETHVPALFLREDQKGFVDRETGAVSLNTVLMPVEATVSPLDAFRHVAAVAHCLNPAADVMLLHVGDDLPLFEGLLPHIELRRGPVVETILCLRGGDQGRHDRHADAWPKGPAGGAARLDDAARAARGALSAARVAGEIIAGASPLTPDRPKA